MPWVLWPDLADGIRQSSPSSLSFLPFTRVLSCYLLDYRVSNFISITASSHSSQRFGFTLPHTFLACLGLKKLLSNRGYE